MNEVSRNNVLKVYKAVSDSLNNGKIINCIVFSIIITTLFTLLYLDGFCVLWIYNSDSVTFCNTWTLNLTGNIEHCF